MKLGTFLFVVSAVAATGCAARPSSFATTVPTSTTRITAAEVVVEDAPKVGKQHHESGLTDDEDTTPSKDGRRSERRHPGGGFSGYK